MPQLFGNKLHLLRLQHQMTQTELARRLGLARPAYISNLEAGRRVPSLHLAVQIAEVFNVTMDYLLRDEPFAEQVSDYTGQGLQRHEIQRFGERLRQLRTQAGITQIDLAHKLDLAAHTHISFLESGRKKPSTDLVLRIADVFGISVDSLFPRTPSDGQSSHC